jgi:peptidoglycan/xylan/chitin deacetylase (PgdA/CDA1 family)
MIGVISKPEEREVVEEFFELFKTPWEFYGPGRDYDVVIAAGEDVPSVNSSLLVVFGTDSCRLDRYELAEAGMQGLPVYIERGTVSLPIYGKAVRFSNPDQPILFCSSSRQTIGYETRGEGQRILRIGYDLFKEVSYLLSEGQPPENASIPTLDLHVEQLRNWIVETGLPLVEIPPVPEGYRFTACLTHDIDFVGIRRHFLDHSMWGFLYRATVGSLLGVVHGKISLSKLGENLKAALSLPLVFLGVSRDPWCQFDRCLEIEGGVPSTFFFIPFKNRAGEGFGKKRAKRRATRYDIGDVGDIIQKLVGHGCEIGVHGIDAWHSVEDGREELRRIREKLTSYDGLGIRTHWLSRNEHTFETLDKAGYSYDSSFGYNETVGFKAGTAQAFKPIGTKTLLEIPLQIQDTALFGRGRLNISETCAEELCHNIIDHVCLYGGVLTVLWHQRSLGPERQWGDFYERLLKTLRKRGAWIATADEVAYWFRMRRLASFEGGGADAGEVLVNLDVDRKKAIPQLVMRSYKQKNCRVFESHTINI